jgi:hypothetical protein
MQERDEVTPSTSSRKRRIKSSFTYSTMKELQKAREYKKKPKVTTGEPSSMQKILKYPTRLEK